MKRILLLCFFSFNLFLYGANIHLVDYASQADFKAYLVDYASQADIKVYIVDYASQAKGDDDHWYFVDYASQADSKIYWVIYSLNKLRNPHTEKTIRK